MRLGYVTKGVSINYEYILLLLHCYMIKHTLHISFGVYMYIKNIQLLHVPYLSLIAI